MPIRPRNWFGVPTLKSGNNAGTLRVPFPFLPCFCVPSDTRKFLKFQIKVLCHGRGREFESRRPRHSFQTLAKNWQFPSCNNTPPGTAMLTHVSPTDGGTYSLPILPDQMVLGENGVAYASSSQVAISFDRNSGQMFWDRFFSRLVELQRCPGRQFTGCV